MPCSCSSHFGIFCYDISIYFPCQLSLFVSHPSSYVSPCQAHKDSQMLDILSNFDIGHSSLKNCGWGRAAPETAENINDAIWRGGMERGDRVKRRAVLFNSSPWKITIFNR